MQASWAFCSPWRPQIAEQSPWTPCLSPRSLHSWSPSQTLRSRGSGQGECVPCTLSFRDPGALHALGPGGCSPQPLGKLVEKEGGRSSWLTWTISPICDINRGKQAAVIRAAGDSGIPWRGGEQTGSHRIPHPLAQAGLQMGAGSGQTPTEGAKRVRSGIQRCPLPTQQSVFPTRGGLE